MKTSSLLHLINYMLKSKKNSARQYSGKPAGPVFLNKNNHIVLHVLAKPGAKSNGVTGIEEDGVGIQINARPVDGEANSELVKYVTSVLGLKKNEICLDKGAKSRQKILLISRKDIGPEDIIEKLKEQINKNL